MLEKLCNLNGVSGTTDAVKDFIINEIKPYVSEITVMPCGNIIAFKKGKNTPPKKVMIDAHIDEVGLIVKDITEDGYLKFDEVGGFDERILLSERVTVGENCVPGIIGIKAVHLATKEEREKTVPISEMYIDIGVFSKEEAEEYVKKGDTIAFLSSYKKIGSNSIKAKALDDRVGVAALISALKKDAEYDYYAAFTVSEEIGTVGAQSAAEFVKPDIALVLEGTTCSDVPGTREHEQSTNQGKGPVLSVVDRASYSDKKLNQFIKKTAYENNITFQLKRTEMGGNNARSIQLSGCGVKTAVLSVPLRYIHSPVSVMNLSDYTEYERLLECFLNNLGNAGEIYD